MATVTQAAPVSNKMLWAGRIVSALLVLMLLFSGIMKFTNSSQLTEMFGHLGLDTKLAFALGILELTCTILYALPRTAVLGAILLTGYMGGTIVSHLRVGDQFLTQIVVGVLVWVGIYLRDARLRALIPLRRSEEF
jgi:uncharacterized membrane protein YphA (DoxX/SURF4 family)